MDGRCGVQVAVLAIFFHKVADDPGVAAAGLLSAVLGLVLFLDGLRLSIMPMAMQVCRQWRSPTAAQQP